MAESYASLLVRVKLPGRFIAETEAAPQLSVAQSGKAKDNLSDSSRVKLNATKPQGKLKERV
jgi:hypothetical protein